MLGVLLIVWLSAAPSIGADQKFVKGSIKSADGKVPTGLSMSLKSKVNPSGSLQIRIDKDGEFQALLPIGTLIGTVDKTFAATSNSTCIYGTFEFDVTDETSRMDLLLPRSKMYEFSFIDTLNKSVPVDIVSIRNLPLEDPGNPDFKNVDFRCTGAIAAGNFFNNKYLFNGFESRSDAPTGVTNFAQFYGPLGEKLQLELPKMGWKTGKFQTVLSDVPAFSLKKADIKVSARSIKGVANFAEVPRLKELAVKREFRIMVRVLQGKIWQSWQSMGNYGLTNSYDELGNFNFSLSSWQFRNRTIEIGFVGLFFTASSDRVQIRVPKS